MKYGCLSARMCHLVCRASPQQTMKLSLKLVNLFNVVAQIFYLPFLNAFTCDGTSG